MLDSIYPYSHLHDEDDLQRGQQVFFIRISTCNAFKEASFSLSPVMALLEIINHALNTISTDKLPLDSLIDVLK